MAVITLNQQSDQTPRFAESETADKFSFVSLLEIKTQQFLSTYISHIS